MAAVPPFRRFPYQEDKILSYKHNELAEYLKLLIKDLSDMYSELANVLNEFESGVEAHHTTHEDGGSDEISVAALSGELADPQTPKTHKTSHQDGGADEISVAGLNGVLADKQDANKLQARNVDSAAPSEGDVLTWDQANTKWKPAAPPAGGGGLGNYVAKNPGTVYQAATDGFFIVDPQYTGACTYEVYTDASNPPTTLRVRGTSFGTYGAHASCCVPVLKNWYYKVAIIYGSNPDHIWWVPLGA